MGYLPTIAIAIALGFDTFSVGIAAGIEGARRDWGAMARLSLSFGFFQFAMNLGGYYLGASIGEMLARYDHWAAACLLFFIGIKMIWDAFTSNAEASNIKITKGIGLLTLSVATSIDALAVGVSLGLIGAPIVLLSIIIGIVAAIMTLIGVVMGSILGELVGKRAAVIGGIALLAIGMKILGEHIL